MHFKRCDMLNKDFVFMWWRDGFNKGSHSMYFRASQYGLAYDNLNGSLKKLGNLPPSTEEAASVSDNAEIDALPDISSSIGVLVSGKEHKCTALEQIDMWGAHSRILEMGSCRCSMDVMYYTFDGDSRYAALLQRFTKCAFVKGYRGLCHVI